MAMPDMAAYSAIEAPPTEVQRMMEAGHVEITRRVDIFESDSITPWTPGGEVPRPRLITGQLSIDYSSDERRKFDVVLENLDDQLRPDYANGLWYDKILKPFYGIRYKSAAAPAPTVILTDTGTSLQVTRLLQTLRGMGYDAVAETKERDVHKLSKYSIIIAFTNQTTAFAYAASTLGPLYEMGRTVVTIGGGPVAGLPHYTAASSVTTQGITPVLTDNPAQGAWVTESTPSPGTVTLPTGLGAGVQRIASWSSGAVSNGTTAALARNGNRGYWLDIHLNDIHRSQATALLRAVLRYTRTSEEYTYWETQLGEFMIDQLGTQHFPDTVKITGRDLTKKLMGSKLTKTSVFVAGMSLKNLVIGQLSLSGIANGKIRLSIGSEVLTTEMAFERGTSRWDIIKSALDSYGYERYFDASGNFVARRFRDPSTSPSAWGFGTGPTGNLVTHDRSINDSQLYNKVIVTATPGESSENPLGFYGEVEIEDINSPVHKNRIGERALSLDADWLDSDADCLALASERLRVAALESYEINFSSISYPWLEVGEIVTVIEPDARAHEPTRFLLDSIQLPLGLGAMSATGKRVTFVGGSIDREDASLG